VTVSLEQRIQDLKVEPGTVACVWLGQAGYLFKSPEGVIVIVDPYLSDYAEQQWGMPRAIPPALDIAAIKPDLLLSSHWHEDHLDQPVIRHWAKDAPGIFVGPGESHARATAWGWPKEKAVRLDRGETYTYKDVTITATFARHEALAPDAVGFLLDVGGVRIWDVADTEYDARLRPMRDERIDVAMIPINGVGGNLNVYEAALLLWQVKPKLAIPMHYNMWAPAVFGEGATLDPNEFVSFYERLGGGEARILTVGEIETFGASSGG
jgi:L-ascorbate 6-phosphate lactonase